MLKSKLFKSAIFLLTITSAYYCYAYVSDQDRYRLINEIERDNNFGWNKICSSYDEIEIFENNCSSFSFIDQIAVHCQKLTQRFYQIEKNKIKYYSRRTKSFYYTEIIKNCNQKYDMVYRISYPIVSPDRKTVLIKITQDCNCMLGGQGGTYVFKKINNYWKLIDSYNYWIS
jgi:hypothetical protein